MTTRPNPPQPPPLPPSLAQDEPEFARGPRPHKEGAPGALFLAGLREAGIGVGSPRPASRGRCPRLERVLLGRIARRAGRPRPARTRGTTPMRPKRDPARADQSPDDPKLGSFGAAIWRVDLDPKLMPVVLCAIRPRAEIGFVRSKSRGSRRVAIRRIAKERGEARPPRLIRSAAEGSRFHDSENHRAEFRIFHKTGRNPPRCGSPSAADPRASRPRHGVAPHEIRARHSTQNCSTLHR